MATGCSEFTNYSPTDFTSPKINFQAMRKFVFLCTALCSVNAFLDQAFDPNAINGFPSGNFNPNGQLNTIAPPNPSGGGIGGAAGFTGFNPNAGQWSTIAPPQTQSGSGSNGGFGGFNPNGQQASTSSWGFGGRTALPGNPTPVPSSGNFGNMWGSGFGPGGFNPNAGFSTVAPGSGGSTASPNAWSGAGSWGGGGAWGAKTTPKPRTTVFSTFWPKTSAFSTLWAKLTVRQTFWPMSTTSPTVWPKSTASSTPAPKSTSPQQPWTLMNILKTSTRSNAIPIG